MDYIKDLLREKLSACTKEELIEMIVKLYYGHIAKRVLFYLSESNVMPLSEMKLTGNTQNLSDAIVQKINAEFKELKD